MTCNSLSFLQCFTFCHPSPITVAPYVFEAALPYYFTEKIYQDQKVYSQQTRPLYPCKSFQHWLSMFKITESQKNPSPVIQFFKFFSKYFITDLQYSSSFKICLLS